jgi:hypothetical protein
MRCWTRSLQTCGTCRVRSTRLSWCVCSKEVKLHVGLSSPWMACMRCRRVQSTTHVFAGQGAMARILVKSSMSKVMPQPGWMSARQRHGSSSNSVVSTDSNSTTGQYMQRDSISTYHTPKEAARGACCRPVSSTQHTGGCSLQSK